MKHSSFSRWRSFLWPIHRAELRKFLPMLFMLFLISFNYNVLRAYKDTIVITASNSGAETIAFLKLWAVLPSAILFTLLFTRLSNWFQREKVFTIIMSIFISFFLLFAFVLYPLQEVLHPNAMADKLQGILPKGFMGFIAIWRNWTYSLFYIMAELWSTTALTVLFWGFANEVTAVGEAKRYYGLLTFGGNVAGMFAGSAAIMLSSQMFISWIPYGKTSWDQSILFVCVTLSISALLTLLLYRWLNKRVIRPAEAMAPKKPKIKMSMRENFAYLARSKYLLSIAVIVFAYNVAINLVEVVWKDRMKALFPLPADYNVYMGEVMFAMAIIASIGGLLATTKVIQRYSWTTSALITPVIVFTTGMLFFGSFYQMMPLALTVLLGSMQNCLSRASKYTFFDATKEIAFIPLDAESKLKGKAAIDGVGSRLGKSGGSVIHSGLILICSSVASSTPYVALVFCGIIGIWALAIVYLGRRFDSLVIEEEARTH